MCLQTMSPLKCKQGQASDIRIHAEEIHRLSKRLNQLYSKHTGQPEDVIGAPAACAPSLAVL